MNKFAPAIVLSEKLIKGGGAFLITVLIANNFTSKDFGAIVYGQTIMQILMVICSFGMNGPAQKRLLQTENIEKIRLVISIFWLQITLGVISAVTGIIYLYYFNTQTDVNTVCTIMMIGLIFKAYESIKYYNESESRFFANVYAEATSYAVFILMIFLIIFYNLDIEYLALLFAFEGLIFIAIYVYGISEVKIYKIVNVNLKSMKVIVSDAWPYFLSSLFGVLYMRVDGLMINEQLGPESLANYMAAVRIVEIFYFIPAIFLPGLMPKLVNLSQQSETGLSDIFMEIYNKIILVALIIIILLYFHGDILLGMFFGEQYYASSSGLLFMLSWTVLPVFFGVISTHHLMLIDKPKIVYWRTLLGLITMTLLCYFLIPQYGLQGAAFAKLAGFFVGSFSLVLFKDGRSIFWIMIKSFTIKFKLNR
jgi:O-antigen/teichoic acid export membrane protein